MSELPEACTRAAQAQRQGADQAHQGGADPVPLAERDAPTRFRFAPTRLGAGPMAAHTWAVQVDVPGVGDLQSGGTGGCRGNIELLVPVVGWLRGLRREGFSAHRTALRSVGALGRYPPLEASTMPRRSLGLARFAPGLFAPRPRCLAHRGVDRSPAPLAFLLDRLLPPPHPLARRRFPPPHLPSPKVRGYSAHASCCPGIG